MRTNRTKELLADGASVVGGWVVGSDPTTTETMADVGFDFVVIDTEHAPQGPLELQAHLMALKDTHATPIVRVLWNDFVRVKQALDLGAEGIIFPWVSTADDARKAVASTRYPPQGIRGWGPRRAVRLAANNEDYLRQAGDNILVLCQIETEEAMEKLDDIAATEGVDALMIGPADLSIALGVPFEWAGERFTTAVHRVRDAAEKAGIAFGVITSGAALAQMWIREGARVIVAGSDGAFLKMMAKETFEEIRGVLGEQ
jgi:2-keto-3-deoxy-L-rhamnonate aldolase RhmA